MEQLAFAVHDRTIDRLSLGQSSRERTSPRTLETWGSLLAGRGCEQAVRRGLDSFGPLS